MELALSVLQRMDVAILRRLAPMTYEFFGNVPQFYHDMFCEGDTVCIAPWRKSAMLEYFVDEAEALFETGGSNKVSSGIWREEGMAECHALHASALRLNDAQLLIIRCLEDEYLARVKILQKAREYLLEQRVLNLTIEKYKRMACYDSLTGLLNRATFMENMQAEIREAEIRRGQFSLLMLDIDDFKRVNDSHGHLTGDAVLAALGELLGQRLRKGDIAARYGGEELVVLAPNTTNYQVGTMAENLRAAIAAHDFGLPQPITVSIGCSSYRRGEDLNALFARADAAMYQAKRASKNAVAVL